MINIATISTNIKIIDQASATLKIISQALGDVQRNFKEITGAAKESEKAVGAFGQSTSSMSSTLTTLAASIGAAFGVKQILGLSDEMTRITARLNLMNDGLRTTAQLNQNIFDVANRTRAPYQATASMISKLGMQAGRAFKNNDELLKFAELLNKSFKISGTDQMGIESTMYNLTQALASGVLRGQDLNAVFANAPSLIQNIADYIGKDIGQIRKLAAEGELSADIVKNALLSATDDINTKFKTISATWSDIWTQIKSEGIQGFAPVLEALGNSADYIYNHWSNIAPMFYSVAGAVTAMTAAIGAYKIGAMLAAVATDALGKAMLANPLTWVIALLGVVVGLFVKLIQLTGSLKLAWQVFVVSMIYLVDTAKLALIGAWIAIKQTFLAMVAVISTGIMGLVSLVLKAVSGIITAIEKMINFAIDGLNKIPLVNISHVSLVGAQGLVNGAASGLDKAAQYMRDTFMTGFKLDTQGFTNAVNEREAKQQRSLAAIKRESEALKRDNEINVNVNTPALPELTAIKDNTGRTADAVSMSEDYLKYLRELAERDVINRFTTAEIKFEQSNTNYLNSEMDIDGVVRRFNEGMLESINIGSEAAIAYGV